MKRVLKWIGVLIVSLVLIIAGMLISLSAFPISQRISGNACYVQGFETVFCKRGEDKEYVYYHVVVNNGKEVVEIARKIPKRQYNQYFL
jgi:hypothetical protein